MNRGVLLEEQRYDLIRLPSRSGNNGALTRRVVILIGLDRGKALLLRIIRSSPVDERKPLRRWSTRRIRARERHRTSLGKLPDAI